MHERIKEHDRDIRLARTQTSAVSEHAHKTGHYPLWNEAKFIDQDDNTLIVIVSTMMNNNNLFLDNCFLQYY